MMLSYVSGSVYLQTTQIIGIDIVFAVNELNMKLVRLGAKSSSAPQHCY